MLGADGLVVTMAFLPDMKTMITLLGENDISPVPATSRVRTVCILRLSAHRFMVRKHEMSWTDFQTNSCLLNCGLV